MNIAFDLPFLAWQSSPPGLDEGHDVRLIIGIAEGAMDSMGHITASVERFCRLASIGALSSTTRHPADGGVVLTSMQRNDRDGPTFQLASCAIDDRATAVLCDMLLHRQIRDAIRSVSVDAGGPLSPIPQNPDHASSYPAVYPKAGFRLWDEEPEGGDLLFHIELARSVESGDLAALQSVADVWCEAIRAGAYALAPIPPESNYLEPDQVICFGSTLEFPVSRLRAHDACIAGFLNALVALERRMPIREVALTQ